jgi:hypothetical protein
MKLQGSKTCSLDIERGNLTPLDATLDPESLWSEGVVLSNGGQYKEAAWKFAVALFLDFSFDASDMTPVINAIENCHENDSVAMALYSICDRETKTQRAREMDEHSAQMSCKVPLIEMADTIDDVTEENRNAFGMGLCHIIHARCMRQVVIRQCPLDKAAFRHISRLVKQACIFIDAERWMTLQFELGFTCFDVFDAVEAEKWLVRYTTTIDATEAVRLCDKSSREHWAKMKDLALEKLNKVQWMTRTFAPSFGYN